MTNQKNGSVPTGKEQEAGKTAADSLHSLRAHQATFYNWKEKYSRMDNQELEE